MAALSILKCKRNQIKKKAAHKKKQLIKKGSIMSTKRKRLEISLTDLPSNVLIEILARLPLRTLFIVKSVCKTFVFLSTPNPHFINLYSLNASQILVFQFRGFKSPSSLLRLADQKLDCKNCQLKPLFWLPKIGNTYLNRLFLSNSCNGLLYFLQNRPADGRSLVCNPVTSEYIIIPDVDPKIRLDSHTESSWLGFSPGTDQYKVLRISCWIDVGSYKSNENAAQVFVIGSDSWRDIDGTPLRGHGFSQDLCQALVNGVMYWHDWVWSGLVSFDFEKEKFGEVVLPAVFHDEEFMLKHDTTIGVLGGCIYLSCNDVDAHRVDLWVMNQDSWSKTFVFDTDTVGPRGGPAYGLFRPLQFLVNGEILMLLNGNILLCYDPRTDTLRYFRSYRVTWDRKVVSLTPSIVPLKDTLKIETVLSRLRPRGDEREL